MEPTAVLQYNPEDETLGVAILRSPGTPFACWVTHVLDREGAEAFLKKATMIHREHFRGKDNAPIS